jgi:hypothetical protein
MRPSFRSLLVLLLLAILALPAGAQWREFYATWDDPPNSTGTNTPSVGVIRNNMFVALCVNPPGTTTLGNSYMVPYVNADSGLGRRNDFGYQPDGKFQYWTDGGFDQVQMQNAWVVRALPDSTVIVANNDPTERNILVFKFTGDTVITHPRLLRQVTGARGLFGLAVASTSGHVIVCSDTTSGVTEDIQVFRPLAQWTSSHLDPPLSTINLPDGIYKGIATNANATTIWVADYTNRRVLKFRGTPGSNYTQDTGFNFALAPGDSVPGIAQLPSVVGMAWLPQNNILFVTSAIFRRTGLGYQWSRIHLRNPNNGAAVSTDTSVSLVDVANWNFLLTGAYNNRINGRIPGNASGYASTYDVQFDAQGNLYSQSHYGWTVEKWGYNGSLPIITGVEEISLETPQGFELGQNYPNPFNPSTTIEFSLVDEGYVSLKVYDLLGKEVADLVGEDRPAGSYRIRFDARDLTSGTYFYTLRSGARSETRRMMLVK